MKLRYELTKSWPNGLKEEHSQEVDGAQITVGRGGASALVIDGRGIALEHVRFELRNNRLFAVDVSHGFGLRINQNQVGEKRLRSGDVLSVGERTFTVQLEGEAAEGGLVRLVEIQIVDAADRQGVFVRQGLERTAVRKHLPSMRGVSIFAAAVTLICAGILPAVSHKEIFFSAGPLVRPHRLIERDCGTCHDQSFSPVKDQACMACHKMSEHGEDFLRVAGHPKVAAIGALLKDPADPSEGAASGVAKDPHHGGARNAHNVDIGRCGDCHMDHNGDDITPKSSMLCIRCHNSPSELEKALGRKADEVQRIPDWEHHPQFQITLSEGDKGALRRVSLADPAAKDSTPIKLNHKVHLQHNLRGPNGPVTLQCNDCHSLKENFREMKPITFNQNCAGCHPLTFDDQLSSEQVPHGDPNVVYGFLYGEYAKLLLGEQSQDVTKIERRLPGQAGTRAEERASERAFAQKEVISQARAAENLLFTKTACQLCHTVKPVSSVDKDSADEDKLISAFAIVRPNIPDRWLPRSLFGHGAHEEVSCESCHTEVRSSQATSDLLLPKRELCMGCHTGHAEIGKVQSECTMCHTFHDSLPIPADEKNKFALK